MFSVERSVVEAFWIPWGTGKESVTRIEAATGIQESIRDGARCVFLGQSVVCLEVFADDLLEASCGRNFCRHEIASGRIGTEVSADLSL
jgi:hypothetical protein